MLAVRGVGVSYRKRAGLFGRARFWALKKVSFELRHGETLGVVGRNGAGKSTLLRLLAGIIEPDRGEIIGEHGGNATLLSLQVGFSGFLSGRDNAILSGMLLGVSRREMEEQMDAIIEFSELGEFIDEPVSSYSTGMRARLGFAVAFMTDPEITLIDETLGVGDIEFQKKSMEAMIQKIRSDKTIVFVSHNLNQVERLCDRVLWIENGESRMLGRAEEVVGSYRAAYS